MGVVGAYHCDDERGKGAAMTLARRALLAGAGTALLAGCSLIDEFGGGQPTAPDVEHCRTPGPLVEFDHVGKAALGYEGGKAQVTMRSEKAFLQQLQMWAEDWAKLSGLGAIRRVWSYGAYTDKCNSYHQLGRAFDIARLEHAKGTISCRYDQWRGSSKGELRNYWRLAASLHEHFAYTLTYTYNAQHANHIHIDNAVNGPGKHTTFDPESRVQVQLVQYSLTNVHGVDVEASGAWDRATQKALAPVQRRLGISEPLGEPAGWRAYLRATAAG